MALDRTEHVDNQSERPDAQASEVASQKLQEEASFRRVGFSHFPGDVPTDKPTTTLVDYGLRFDKQAREIQPEILRNSATETEKADPVTRTGSGAVNLPDRGPAPDVDPERQVPKSPARKQEQYDDQTANRKASPPWGHAPGGPTGVPSGDSRESRSPGRGESNISKPPSVPAESQAIGPKQRQRDDDPWEPLPGVGRTVPTDRIWLKDVATIVSSGVTFPVRSGADWLGKQFGVTESDKPSPRAPGQPPAERNAGDTRGASVPGSQNGPVGAKSGSDVVAANVTRPDGDKPTAKPGTNIVAPDAPRPDGDKPAGFSRTMDRDDRHYHREPRTDANKATGGAQPNSHGGDSVPRQADRPAAPPPSPRPDAARPPEARPGNDGRQVATADLTRVRADAPTSGPPVQNRQLDTQDPQRKPPTNAARSEAGGIAGGGDRQTEPAQGQRQATARSGEHRPLLQSGDLRTPGRSDAGDKPGDAARGSQRAERPPGKTGEPAVKEAREAGGDRQGAQTGAGGAKAGGDGIPIPTPALFGTDSGGNSSKPQGKGANTGEDSGKSIKDADGASGKTASGASSEGSASGATRGERSGNIDTGGREGSKGEPSGVKGDRGATAGGTTGAGPGAGKGTGDGARGQGGVKEIGQAPGRTGSDGVKIGDGVKVSGDAGRSGVDGGRIGSGFKDGPAIKDSLGVKGSAPAVDGRGIDIPIVLPPRLPNFGFVGQNGGKSGASVGDTPSKGSSADAGDKGSIKPGPVPAPGDKTPSGVAQPGDKGSIKPGPVPAPGDKTTSDAAQPGDKGSIRPGTVPAPGDKTTSGAPQPGDKGSVKPGTVPAPGDKTPSGAAQPGDKGSIRPGTVPAPGDKTTSGAAQTGDKASSGTPAGKPGIADGGKGPDGTKLGPREGQMPEARGDRAPFIPVGIPPGYGFDQTGSSGSRVPGGAHPGYIINTASPPGKIGFEAGGKDVAGSANIDHKQGHGAEVRGDRVPFIPVAITPGYGFAQASKGGNAMLTAGRTEQDGMQASAGQDSSARSASPDRSTAHGAQPGDRTARTPGAASDMPVTTQYIGMDRGTARTAPLGDKTAVTDQQPGKSLSKDATAAEKPVDSRTRQTSESPYRLPGLELFTEGDHRDTAAGERVLKPRFGGSDTTSSNDSARRVPPQAKSSTDELVEFVRANRQALEQAMKAQSGLNPAFLDFVGIMQRLEAAGATESLDFSVHGVADAGNEEPSADASAIRNALQHADDRERTGQGRQRRIYLVQEHDTVESIAAHHYGDERIGALIHELNKDVIPSTYLYDKIVVDLKPGSPLELPTDEEIESFFEQITEVSLPTFEYTQARAKTEQELSTWEESRRSETGTLNPYASLGTTEIESTLTSLKRAADTKEGEDPAKPASEDAGPVLE